MSIDKEIVEDFVGESKSLIEELISLLESIEGEFSQVRRLAEYGNSVDRIMGGAQSLAMLVPPEHALHMISDYAALCKAVGYKASQIRDNEQFFDVCVALLLDATETLRQLVLDIHRPSTVLKEIIPQAFIERLRWVSQRFDESFSMSVDVGNKTKEIKMGQNDIDDLLKRLGL